MSGLSFLLPFFLFIPLLSTDIKFRPSGPAKIQVRLDYSGARTKDAGLTPGSGEVTVMRYVGMGCRAFVVIEKGWPGSMQGPQLSCVCLGSSLAFEEMLSFFLFCLFLHLLLTTFYPISFLCLSFYDYLFFVFSSVVLSEGNAKKGSLFLCCFFSCFVPWFSLITYVFPSVSVFRFSLPLAYEWRLNRAVWVLCNLMCRLLSQLLLFISRILFLTPWCFPFAKYFFALKYCKWILFIRFLDCFF